MSAMETVTLKGLIDLSATVVQSCWHLGTTLFEMTKEKDRRITADVAGLLMHIEDESAQMREVLAKFHSSLKTLSKENPDEEEYEPIFQAAHGAVDDCGYFTRRCTDLLQRSRIAADAEDDATQGQHSRMGQYQPDLVRCGKQVLVHKLNVSVCLAMLIVHICSGLASRKTSGLDARQRQLPMAYTELKSVLDLHASSTNQALEAWEGHHVYRLAQTAQSVLTTARSVSSRTPTAAYLDEYTADTKTESFGQFERELIDAWISQLAVIKREKPKAPEETVEPYVYSDLPEVASIFTSQQPSAPSVNGSSGHSVGAASGRPTSERPMSEYAEDDLELEMVHSMITTGKDHFSHNNRAQAIDCLTRALEHASQLSAPSQRRVDMAEVRAILGTIALQRRDIATAELHLRTLLQESAPTPENQHHISTAHHHLAQCCLVQRRFESAAFHAKEATRSRSRLYGKQAPPTHDALATQALVFHAQGAHPEAEALLTMLPKERADQLRGDMQQQAQGGPKLTLFPAPRGNRVERPSMSSERPVVSERPAWNDRPNTGRGTVFSSFSNGSRYSNDSGPGYKQAPSSPAMHLDRSQSQPATMQRAPAFSALPFRASPRQPSSPRQQDIVAFDAGPINGRLGRSNSAIASPPSQLHQMEIAGALQAGGFTGDFDVNKALIWAIQNGLRQVVQALLEGYTVPRSKRRFSLGNDATGYIVKHASPNGSEKDKDKDRLTPLIAAIQHGQVLIAKDLLARGAEPSYKVKKRLQPLMVASEHGSAEIVRLLFDYGVTADHTGQRRAWTAWHAAAQAGHHEVVQLFLEKSAVVDAEDPAGATALKLAAARGHESVCDLLLHNFAQIDKADDNGWTGLLSSIKHSHMPVTQLLVDTGADIDQTNNKRQSPLMVAAREGRLSEANLLLQKGAMIEQTDDNSYTPLLYATRYGHVEIVQLLITAGANVNAHCTRNSTPLDHAVKNKHKAIQQFLKAKGAHHGSGLTEGRTQNTAFSGYTM